MKVYHTILLFVSLFAQDIWAQQSGSISYTETTKLNFEGLEGMGLGDMLPKEMNTAWTLSFDKTLSVYRTSDEQETEDIELKSDDGSFEMVLGTNDTEEILFIDQKTKESLYQTSFMEKEFLITSDLTKHKWKITNERIKYLDFVCQKATMTETVLPSPGSEEPAKEVEVVAWFTSEIPASVGPRSYNQLPGAILMVSVDDGKTEIKATFVNVEPLAADLLIKPTKGQKVTSEEYEKIMAEKMKEMSEMYGGSEGTIMIRG